MMGKKKFTHRKKCTERTPPEGRENLIRIDNSKSRNQQYELILLIILVCNEGECYIKLYFTFKKHSHVCVDLTRMHFSQKIQGK